MERKATTLLKKGDGRIFGDGPTFERLWCMSDIRDRQWKVHLLLYNLDLLTTELHSLEGFFNYEYLFDLYFHFCWELVLMVMGLETTPHPLEGHHF